MQLKHANKIRALNLIFFLVGVGIIYMAQRRVFGQTFPEVSAQYNSLLTPARFAFSIWLLIFAYEAVMVLAQLFPVIIPHAIVAKGFSIWFVLVNIAQACWAILFSKNLIIPATVAMCVTLLCLMKLMSNLHNLRSSYYKNSESFISFPSMLFVVLPLSIHYAWIFVATIANANILILSRYSPSEIPTTLMLAVAILSFALITAFAFSHSLFVQSPDFLSVLTMAWAVMGLGYRYDNDKSLSTTYGTPIIDALRMVSECLMILFLALSVLALLRGIHHYMSSARSNKIVYIKQDDEMLPTFNAQYRATAV